MKPSTAFQIGLGSVLYIIGGLSAYYVIIIKKCGEVESIFDLITRILCVSWFFFNTGLIIATILIIPELIRDWLREEDRKYMERKKKNN